MEKALDKAVKLGPKRESGAPEHFLHLSFWRYLVRKPYYTSLWVPRLHKGFSGLEDPKSIGTFKELDSKFGRALKVRNHIAHYSMDWGFDAEVEIKNLLWLIKALDAKLVESALYLLSDT